MRVETARKRSRTGEQLKVVAVNENEQTRRVQEAVVRRVYGIFDSRDSASWHELEDWRQAESTLSQFSLKRVEGGYGLVTSSSVVTEHGNGL